MGKIEKAYDSFNLANWYFNTFYTSAIFRSTEIPSSFEAVRRLVSDNGLGIGISSKRTTVQFDPEVSTAQTKFDKSGNYIIAIGANFIFSKFWEEKMGVKYDERKASRMSLGIMNGFVSHEIAHCAYSDYTYHAGVKVFVRKNSEDKFWKENFFSLMTLVEDINVERRFKRDFGNLYRFVEDVRKYVLNTEDDWKEAYSTFEDEPNLENSLDLLRFCALDKYRDYTIYPQELQNAAYSIIKTTDNAFTNTYNVLELCEEIYDEVIDETDDQEERDKEPETGEGEGQESSESGMSGGGAEGFSGMSEEDKAKMKNGIAKINETMSSENFMEDERSMAERMKFQHNVMSSGGKDLHYFDIMEIPFDKDADKRFKGANTAGALAESLARFDIERKERVTITDHGRFNTSMLGKHKLYSKPKMFNVREKKVVRGVPLVRILMDLSGSTHSRAQYGSSDMLVDYIISGSYYMSQELTKNRISHSVYAHTTGRHGVEVFGIYSFNSRFHLNNPKQIITTPDIEKRFLQTYNIDSAGNADGDVIYSMHHALYNPADLGYHNMYIVVSDGRPSDSLNRENASTVLKRSIAEIRSAPNCSIVSFSVTEDVMEDNNEYYGQQYNFLGDTPENFALGVSRVIEELL